MRKDIPYIHFIRIIACISVICMHTVLSYSDKTFEFAVLVKYLTRPNVPFFYMITGILILPAKEDILLFYKKRVLKVLYPLLIWCTIYSFVSYCTDCFDFKTMIRCIVMSPITYPKVNGGVLWFLYVLIGIYLIIPFINPNIYSKKNITIYLFVWILASMSYPVRAVIPNMWGNNPWERPSDMVTYFSGYFGYLLMGYYLHHYVNIYKYKRLMLSMFIFIYMVCVVVLYRGIWNDVTYLSIITVIMTACLFLFIKLLFDGVQRTVDIVAYISKLTFGMYLNHILIVQFMKRYMDYLGNTVSEQILICIINVVLSALLTIIFSKLPFKKYVIGL